MGSIVLNTVEKWYGAAQVIKGIDLEIFDGEFIVFVGPSGCGKSTLLRMIGGLEDISRGTLDIDGRDVTAEPPSKRGLAMVFQSYALYPHMSVRDNMGFSLKTAGAPKSEIKERSMLRQRSSNLNRISIAVQRTCPGGSDSVSPSVGVSCATPQRSCLTNLCRTSMLPCALRCGLRLPNSITV